MTCIRRRTPADGPSLRPWPASSDRYLIDPMTEEKMRELIDEARRNAEESIGHARAQEGPMATDPIAMPEQIVTHNACATRCDMAAGPCACGAWHSLDEWKGRLGEADQKLIDALHLHRRRR